MIIKEITRKTQCFTRVCPLLPSAKKIMRACELGPLPVLGYTIQEDTAVVSHPNKRQVQCDRRKRWGHASKYKESNRPIPAAPPHWSTYSYDLSMQVQKYAPTTIPQETWLKTPTLKEKDSPPFFHYFGCICVLGCHVHKTAVCSDWCLEIHYYSFIFFVVHVQPN